MAILYTVDSRTVDEAEFKERISDTGYYDLPQGERTRKWIKELRSLPHAKHSDDDDAVALAMAGERYRKEFEMEPVLNRPLPKFCIANHCTERGPKCDKCAYTAFSS